MPPIAVARTSSDGVAIRYLFPVLWMTPLISHITVLRRVMCIFKRRWKSTSISADIPTKFCWTIKTGSSLVSCASEAKFAIYHCHVTEVQKTGKTRNVLLLTHAVPQNISQPQTKSLALAVPDIF